MGGTNGGDLFGGDADRLGDSFLGERPAEGGVRRPSLNEPKGDGDGELSSPASDRFFLLNMLPRRVSAILSLGTFGDGDDDPVEDILTFIDTPPLLTDDCMRRCTGSVRCNFFCITVFRLATLESFGYNFSMVSSSIKPTKPTGPADNFLLVVGVAESDPDDELRRSLLPTNTTPESSLPDLERQEEELSFVLLLPLFPKIGDPTGDAESESGGELPNVGDGALRPNFQEPDLL